MLPDQQFRERPLTGTGGPSVHLPYALRPSRGIIIDPMAPRDRRQRSTMERSSRRGGGMAIQARLERLIDTLFRRQLSSQADFFQTRETCYPQKEEIADFLFTSTVLMLFFSRISSSASTPRFPAESASFLVIGSNHQKEIQ